jgi:hypothetical protein
MGWRRRAESAGRLASSIDRYRDDSAAPLRKALGFIQARGARPTYRRRKTQRRHRDADLRRRPVQRAIPVVLLLQDSRCAGQEFHGHQLEGALSFRGAARNKKLSRPQRQIDRRGELATATHYAAKKAISHFGLNSDRDVTYVALGALQTRLTALENNAIQASILSAPWHLLAKQFGGRELLFVGDVLEMPSGGLCSTEKLLKEDPQLIKRMIRATLRTFRKVRDSRDDAISFWSQQLKLDPAQASAVFDDIPKTTSANGILTGEAQRTLIDAGQLLGALQGPIDPSKASI